MDELDQKRSPPLPSHFVIRPGTQATINGSPHVVSLSGPIVPLIPIDLLPDYVEIIGIPRQLKPEQCGGLVNVGAFPRPADGGTPYQVVIHRGGTISPKALPLSSSTTLGDSDSVASPMANDRLGVLESHYLLHNSNASMSGIIGRENGSGFQGHNTLNNNSQYSSHLPTVNNNGRINNLNNRNNRTNRTNRTNSNLIGGMTISNRAMKRNTKRLEQMLLEYGIGRSQLGELHPTDKMMLAGLATNASVGSGRKRYAGAATICGVNAGNHTDTSTTMSTDSPRMNVPIPRSGTVLGSMTGSTGGSPSQQQQLQQQQQDGATATTSSATTSSPVGTAPVSPSSLPSATLTTTTSTTKSNPTTGSPTTAYCRHWCQHGTCKWGLYCRYAHNMPTTPAGLREVGLSDFPAWWTAAMGIAIGGRVGAEIMGRMGLVGTDGVTGVGSEFVRKNFGRVGVQTGVGGRGRGGVGGRRGDERSTGDMITMVQGGTVSGIAGLDGEAARGRIMGSLGHGGNGEARMKEILKKMEQLQVGASQSHGCSGGGQALEKDVDGDSTAVGGQATVRRVKTGVLVDIAEDDGAVNANTDGKVVIFPGQEEVDGRQCRLVTVSCGSEKKIMEDRQNGSMVEPQEGETRGLEQS